MAVTWGPFAAGGKFKKTIRPRPSGDTGVSPVDTAPFVDGRGNMARGVYPIPGLITLKRVEVSALACRHLENSNFLNNHK